MGKARLAPAKVVTIPRLELTAPTVSVRLAELLKKEMEGNTEFMYHTDSTTILRYITNEHKRFHVFVANRIQLIQDHSEVRQWRFVDTKENPADDASRGSDGPTLLRQQRWLEGPDFLWKPEDDWPQQPFAMGQIPDDGPEIKKTTESHATSISQPINPTSKLIHYFSDWYRLKKAVAVFLCVKGVLQEQRDNCLKLKGQSPCAEMENENQRIAAAVDTARFKGTNGSRSPLTVQELLEAEYAIFKFVQASVFDREIYVLKKLGSEKELNGRILQKRRGITMPRPLSL